MGRGGNRSPHGTLGLPEGPRYCGRPAQTVTLIETDHWITHCNFYDRGRVLFCHAANEHAILMTDLHGGWYKHLRTMKDSLQTCHYQATTRGIVYEVVTHGRKETGLIGICDPHTNRCREYQTSRPVYHVGYDAEGRLWFDSDSRISYFPVLEPDKLNEPVDLTGPVQTCSKGQRSHLYGAVMPGRRHRMSPLTISLRSRTPIPRPKPMSNTKPWAALPAVCTRSNRPTPFTGH